MLTDFGRRPSVCTLQLCACIPVANYMVQEAEVQANRPTTLKNKLLPLSVPGVLNEE